jgi:hypothetical protein
MNLAMPVLSGRPRKVPLSTRVVVLLDGPFAVWGWLFFACGTVFARLFAGNADLTSWLLFRGQVQTAPGIITASEPTHFSQGGGEHSKGTPIVAHHYRFAVSGTNYQGVSFCTGGGLRKGQSVVVEFIPDKPELSRIRGMRRQPFGPAAGAVVLFPVTGLALVAMGLVRGHRQVQLLAQGEPALGRLVDKQPTNVRVNNKPVYKLLFEFTDRDGQTQRAVVETEKVEPLEDEPFEWLFYAPRKPDQAVLLDALPGKQKFDEHGALKPAGFWRAAVVLLLPALGLGAVVVSVGLVPALMR